MKTLKAHPNPQCLIGVKTLDNVAAICPYDADDSFRENYYLLTQQMFYRFTEYMKQRNRNNNQMPSDPFERFKQRVLNADELIPQPVEDESSMLNVSQYQQKYIHPEDFKMDTNLSPGSVENSDGENSEFLYSDDDSGYDSETTHRLQIVIPCSDWHSLSHKINYSK